jgi:hypothetical protein
LLAEKTEEEQETLRMRRMKNNWRLWFSFWVHIEEDNTVSEKEINKAMCKILTTKNNCAEFGAGAKDNEDDKTSVLLLLILP